MNFDELFESFFTSRHELEKTMAEYKTETTQTLDKNFMAIAKNEDHGTSFFEQFTNGPQTDVDHPPFQVTAFKTYVMSDQPDLLRQ